MSKANRKHEFDKLIKNRLRGLAPGQELCVLCHPSHETEAQEFALDIQKQLGTGETIGVVTDKDCPVGKTYIVNRDYYDEFAEEPWKVMH